MELERVTNRIAERGSRVLKVAVGSERKRRPPGFRTAKYLGHDGISIGNHKKKAGADDRIDCFHVGRQMFDIALDETTVRQPIRRSSPRA